MSEKDLKLLKLIVACGGLFYLYHVVKSRGGSLQDAGVKPEAFVNLAGEFIPQEYRNTAKVMGHRLMTKIME